MKEKRKKLTELCVKSILKKFSNNIKIKIVNIYLTFN